MSFNWEIKVASPVLTDGMSFRVRYKKKPNGSWLDFLPNPTTNIFTITNLDEEEYTAEIKTVCADGTLSTPGFLDSPCYGGGGGGDDDTPPLVNIYWTDMSSSPDREYTTDNFNLNIAINATDAENDIVLTELEVSSNNVNWSTQSAITNQIVQVVGTKPTSYYYRVKVTDSKNNTATSNILSVKYKEVIVPDLQITNIQGVYPATCGNEGEEINFDIIGKPNEIVKFQMKCIEVVGHNFNFVINTDTVASAFTWGTVQNGATKDGTLTLNSQGKIGCNAKMCLRPCLNEAYSTATIEFTLYNSDGITLSNQKLRFNAYQDCNI